MENQVPKNHISLRAAATKASTGSGQGFVNPTEQIAVYVKKIKSM